MIVITTVLRCFIFLVLSFFIPAQVQAQQSACGDDCVAIGQWQFSLTLGLGVKTNPVVDQDDVPIIVVPGVSYYGKRFFLETFDAGYTLFDGRHQQLNVLFFTPGYDHVFFNTPGFGVFSLDADLTGALSFTQGGVGLDNSGGQAPIVNPPSDSPPPAGNPEDLANLDLDTLNERRATVLSGFEYSYTQQYFSVHLQALKDLVGVHHGEEYRLALTFPFKRKKNIAGLTFGAILQSARLVDYYYGLSVDELSDNAFVYDAGSALSTYVRLDWQRRLSPKWVFRSALSYRIFADEITNSPIVSEDGVATVFFGGVYHF